MNELLDCAKALSMQPTPRNPDLTIITNAGGPGLLAADRLRLKGGALSLVSADSAKALKNILPRYCKISNPIDILEEATLERYRNVLQICLNDPVSGSVLAIYSPQGITPSLGIASMVTEIAKSTRTPLLVVLMGEDANCQDARKKLNQAGIPAFKSPEAAVSAFMNMYVYTRNLESLYQTPQEIELDVADTVHLKGIIRRAFFEARQLSLPEAFRFLDAYKIPTVKTCIVKSVEEILAFSFEIGYPFTMKPLYTASSNSKEWIAPIDVYSSLELHSLFDQLADKIKSSNFFIEFQGLAIQPKTQETTPSLLLSLRKDSNFGSLIVLGTKNCTQIIDSVGVGFPPLDQILAGQLMLKTLPGNMIQEFGASRCRRIEELIVRFSQIVIDFPELAEIDINLIVDDRGVNASDARIIIDKDRVMREPADHHEDLVITPYPKKYVTVRTLKNGLKVNFRPIKSEDEPRFNDLFKSLSVESVRFRFFETIKELSHDTLSRYCNLDYNREIAIVAELQNDGRIIGIARLIPDFDRKKGEFAIMVGDQWHGLGLGLKLMDYLIEIAKNIKLESIYSLVSNANYKMLNLGRKLGFETKPTDESTVEMLLNLPP